VILDVALPRAGEQMHEGTVRRLIASPGDVLRPGSPLLEIRVDLSSAKAQDCPPIFFFRLVATERAHLRAWTVVTGDVVHVGGVLGVASTSPDEGTEGPRTRSLRTTSVAIQVDPLSTGR
jgi:pyruvate/2-oxoglutarate dehydrogenase complex dihydrolipoamide acyltransferase (E2) component